ncbi:MAG: bifunctional 4-hydroxy-2-oxoglutarate aldolase/2-dehydro-3-deoxy-phosphogluconate aldolase [Candidatus Lokiarchaeota archaeon]|nr:bifunctional 4-hydroxy-2-oxoglutarate aldolase/2-dehydro-3-deoxy-phosphogluconate aldolase [Candidatus Lokiarchaeota archaeon]
MVRFSSIEVYNAIIEQGLVPVFYNGDFEVAKNIISAIAKGGGKIIEFTNRGDFAFEIFANLVKYFETKEPQLIFGVGSVIDPYTAALYINTGANFIVGPALNPDIAKICNRRRIPYSPGCGTATEISRAEELGSEIIKIFPAGILGGPNFVKAILAPNPWTKIMPTGGVDITEESIESWFEAGVVAVGIGSKLITKDLVASKNWDGIAKNVANTLELIQKSKIK